MCSFVSQNVFDYLIKHMLDIHEQKMSIVSSYSIEYDEYMKMLYTIKNYIKRLERFLESVSVSDCPDKIPFVIFGCSIHLNSVGSSDNMVCSIVLPTDSRFYESEDKGVTLIKCCTPAADTLLFKKAGDRFMLDGFGDDVCWKIENIENAY